MNQRIYYIGIRWEPSGPRVKSLEKLLDPIGDWIGSMNIPGSSRLTVHPGSYTRRSGRYLGLKINRTGRYSRSMARFS